MKLTKKLETIFKRYHVEIGEAASIKRYGVEYNLNPVEFAVYKTYCIAGWRESLCRAEEGVVDNTYYRAREAWLHDAKNANSRAVREGFKMTKNLTIKLQRALDDFLYLSKLIQESPFDKLRR